MVVSEQEMAELTRASSGPDKCASYSFGCSIITLVEVPSNSWAIEHILTLRSAQAPAQRGEG